MTGVRKIRGTSKHSAMEEKATYSWKLAYSDLHMKRHTNHMQTNKGIYIF